MSGGAGDVGFTVWLVTDVYPPGCGGSGWSAHALARTLVDQGHDVEVITIDPTRAGVSQRVFEGIRISALGVAASRRSPRRRFGARDYAHRALARYLEDRLQEAPDVRLVHAQHLHSGPPAVAAAVRQDRASVQTLRDYWPVCLHGTSWWNGAECPGCDTTNLVGCMREYWGWPRLAARLMVPWARRRLAARRAGIERADRVITVSHWVRRRIEREAPTVNFEVLPNIVDAATTREAAASAAAVDLPWDGRYLIAAGKLVPTKGFGPMLATLAEAGCELPIVLAGDGPLAERLDRLAEVVGLRVHWPGWIDHAQLLRLIDGAHAFLLPGAWNEPMSRLLLETLSLGTPVIAWRSGGNPEHLDADVNAFVVDNGDELQAALAALEQPDRRRQIGEAGADLARRVFSPAAIYPRVLEIYRAALARHDRRPTGP